MTHGGVPFTPGWRRARYSHHLQETVMVLVQQAWQNTEYCVDSDIWTVYGHPSRGYAIATWVPTAVVSEYFTYGKELF
jgi:hypothetical protein